MTNVKYPAISLFSGAMGCDIGLEQAGLNILIGQDFDAACIKTMENNGYKGLAGDIREIESSTLLSLTGMKAGEPFLVCGGPPCQPFSTAGKRLGINDPRGSLFRDFLRMIDEIRPRFFLLENVKGLMSSMLKDEYGNSTQTKVIDIILEEFKKLNYKTVYGVLDAVNYGVPQFRERFIMIGSRDNENIFLPAPTHFHTHQDPAYRWRTLREAIQDLELIDDECASFGDTRIKYLKMVPEGGNWRDLPETVVKEAMGGAYASGGGKVGFYRRLSYSQPSPTLTTSPIQTATMLCHPTQDRPLSVPEYRRIQQFPEEWRITGSLGDKYKQIGNAVPVGLAKAIGQAIIATANNEETVQVKRFRGTSVHHKIQDALQIGVVL